MAPPCGHVTVNLRFSGSILWPCIKLNLQFGGSTVWSSLELDSQFSGSTLWACLELNLQLSGSASWPRIKLSLLLSCVNCHISRLVDASQIRVSSSRSVKPLSPFGGLCIVQSSMICCTDWFGAPHSHSEVDFRPHRTFLHPFGYGCRLSTVCAAGPDLGRGRVC